VNIIIIIMAILSVFGLVKLHKSKNIG